MTQVITPTSSSHQHHRQQKRALAGIITFSTGIKSRCFSTLITKMRHSILMYSPPTTAIPTPNAMERPQAKRTVSYPSLAFSGSYAMDIPLKATPSPPSTSSSTSSDSNYAFPSASSSLSSSPASSTSTSSFTSVSHPDWPQSDTLSSPSSASAQAASCSANAGSQVSCRITDEDLEDLASLPLWNGIRVPEYYTGNGYGNPQLTAAAYAEERELPPTSLPSKPKKQMKSAGGGRRRRSKEMKRKPLGIMTPISESGEY